MKVISRDIRGNGELSMLIAYFLKGKKNRRKRRSEKGDGEI